MQLGSTQARPSCSELTASDACQCWLFDNLSNILYRYKVKTKIIYELDESKANIANANNNFQTVSNSDKLKRH